MIGPGGAKAARLSDMRSPLPAETWSASPTAQRWPYGVLPHGGSWLQKRTGRNPRRNPTTHRCRKVHQNDTNDARVSLTPCSRSSDDLCIGEGAARHPVMRCGGADLASPVACPIRDVSAGSRPHVDHRPPKQSACSGVGNSAPDLGEHNKSGAARSLSVYLSEYLTPYLNGYSTRYLNRYSTPYVMTHGNHHQASDARHHMPAIRSRNVAHPSHAYARPNEHLHGCQAEVSSVSVSYVHDFADGAVRRQSRWRASRCVHNPSRPR
jgi:hypothetical protein